MSRTNKAAFFILMLAIVTVVARAASVTISNASFETATLPFSGGNGPYSNLIAGSTIAPFGGSLDNWIANSTFTTAAAGGFGPTIGGVNWASKWWTGSNIAYLQTTAAGSVSLSQTLSDTVQNNTTYTLSARIGKRSLGTPLNYSLQLWAGSTMLSSVSNLPLANNTSAMDRLVYNSGPSNPAAGQTLKIVLSSTWVSSTTEAFFDDVSLTAAPTSVTTLVSSPSSTAQLGQTVTLTATVSPSSATGPVTFFDGEAILGIATLAAGQASLSSSLQHSGQRSFKAFYGGDGATGPSNSTSIPFTVNAAPAGSFAAATSHTTLQGPSDLTSGDFNADGKADLAVVDYSSNKVSILLGVGDGTFASHVDYDAGTGPLGIATGDFNGDGKTDLVIADNSAASLKLLFGSGTGTFGSPADLSVGSNPQGVAVGDFNLDGKADIVAANNGSNSVTVLIGNGDGTFQTGISYSTGSGPRGVAIGDFNGDGIPDLAVANHSGGSIGIFLGNGNGSFQAVTLLSAGSPFYLAIADLNGDGKEDMIASTSGNTASVLLGNGNGTFQTYQSYSTGLSPTGIRGLSVTDFNGDGRPDLVLAILQTTLASILYNNGDGTFGNPRSVTVGQGPSDVVAGDFNGDGVPDIAAALFNGGIGSSASVALGSLPPPADLIPQNITLSATALQVGASLTVNWTLANIGTVATSAPSTTTVRINQSTTSNAGTDLAGIATPVLAAGASVAQSVTVTVPATPGTYYVWLVADRFETANQNTFNDAQRSGSFVLTIEPPTLNMSKDLVSLGIASQNMTPNNPSLDSRPLFQLAINYVQSHAGVSVLTVDPGAYYLKTATQSNATLIFGRSNITVDLAGSTFYFNGPLLPNGLQLYYCTNVTLKNFTIDFINLPYTHVQLTSVNAAARVLSYQTMQDWPNPSSFNNLPNPFPVQPILMWAVAFRNGKIVPRTTRMLVTTPISGSTLALLQDQTPWTQSEALAATLQAGDTIVVAPFGGGPPLLVWGGDNVTVSNVTVYGSPAAALQMVATTNSTADGIRLMPRPGTGLLGSNLDGINFLQVGQNNHLRNSYVTGTLDDAITMVNQYAGTVVNKTGARQLTITRGGYSSFPNGTLVNFVDTVTSMEVAGATIISQVPSFVTGFNEPVQLTFDQDLPTNLPAGTGMVYGSDAMRGQGSTIEDNLVEDTYGGRGVWVTGAVGLTIRRNVIRRTSLSGILIENDTGGFPAGPSRDITISDNALDGAIGPAAAGTGTQVALASVHVTSLTSSVNNQPFGLVPANANISAVNNYIADSGRSGMWIGELNGGTLQNNLVIRWNQYPEPALYGIPPSYQQQVIDDFAVPVVIRYSTGVQEIGNTISSTSPITAPVTMTPSSITLSGGGGTGSFQLQTAVTGFGWKATSDAAWLTITSSTTGAGNTTVQYSVAANNTGISRTAHITIAGEVLSVTQDPGKKGRNQLTSQ